MFLPGWRMGGSMKRAGRIYRSVFTKLLIVIIITGFLINLMIGIFFHFTYKSLARSPFQKNLIQYVNYLIDDLGTPPDVERARQIAKRALLEIRYESPDVTWATSDKIPSLKQRGFRLWYQDETLQVGRYRGHHILAVKRGQGVYTFRLAREDHHDKRFFGVVGFLLTILTAVLIGAYLMIRKILKPVKWLAEGVGEVSRGNLDHRVPSRGRDELSGLAEGFNAMTERIGKMLLEKEQLLLDVSHELRSPLTRIKVALELLGPSSEKENVTEDIAGMEKLITRLLETARKKGDRDDLRLEPVDLVTLVQKIVARFENRSPGARLRHRTEKVALMVDPDRAEEAIQNVVENGVKFSAASDAAVTIDIQNQPLFTLIRVQDHGPGIPKEDLPHIFEPFYRVDKSRSRPDGGFGLGLSLCKSIMEAHNGKIKIDTVFGEGTTVYLYFPKQKDESHAGPG